MIKSLKKVNHHDRSQGHKIFGSFLFLRRQSKYFDRIVFGLLYYFFVKAYIIVIIIFIA